MTSVKSKGKKEEQKEIEEAVLQGKAESLPYLS